VDSSRDNKNTAEGRTAKTLMPATAEMPTTIASAGTPTATEVPETVPMQTTHTFGGNLQKKSSGR
jgi:hypothetical protein